MSNNYTQHVITRSMLFEPFNFIHTHHVDLHSMAPNLLSSQRLIRPWTFAAILPAVWGVQKHRKHTRRSLAKTLAAGQYSAKSAARICIARRTPPEITDTTEVSLKDIMSCRLEVPSPWSRHCFPANRVAASMGSPRVSCAWTSVLLIQEKGKKK